MPYLPITAVIASTSDNRDVLPELDIVHYRYHLLFLKGPLLHVKMGFCRCLDNIEKDTPRCI